MGNAHTCGRGKDCGVFADQILFDVRPRAATAMTFKLKAALVSRSMAAPSS